MIFKCNGQIEERGCIQDPTFGPIHYSDLIFIKRKRHNSITSTTIAFAIAYILWERIINFTTRQIMEDYIHVS
jgi:hypothetical protein